MEETLCLPHCINTALVWQLASWHPSSPAQAPPPTTHTPQSWPPRPFVCAALWRRRGPAPARRNCTEHPATARGQRRGGGGGSSSGVLGARWLLLAPGGLRLGVG